MGGLSLVFSHLKYKMFNIALHISAYGYNHEYPIGGRLWKWHLGNMATAPL